MDREVVNAGGKPVGPYSQAVRAGGLLFTAGQIGLDPTTGGLVEGGIKAETRQALENLAKVVAAAGTSLDRALKCTVYLVDMEDFDVMNDTYREFFPSDPPARATVQVVKLWGSARIEIELVAAV